MIKDIRNLFRLKKEQNNPAVKNLKNLFRLKKDVKGIKDIVPRIFLGMNKKRKTIIN